MKYIRRREPWTEEVVLSDGRLATPLATFTTEDGYFVRHVILDGDDLMVVYLNHTTMAPDSVIDRPTRRYWSTDRWRMDEIRAVAMMGPTNPAPRKTCCRACWEKENGAKAVAVGDALWNPLDMPMIVCTVCGNKRCPKATDHENECTGSNEPGQKGSIY